jgi:3-oxoacyl-[acyl-carrier protein] reductase
MKLQDKVAIITGAGQGIGREYALRFAHEGAKVALADIREENVHEAAREVEAKGGDALGLHVDVSKTSSTLEMAEKTLERFGKVDVLLNNAALGHTP